MAGQIQSYKIGTLVLTAKSTLATFLYKVNEIAWIDLASGDVVFNDPKPAVSFPKWEISIPESDGSHRIICKIIPGPLPGS